jgi:hypothetical protein
MTSDSSQGPPTSPPATRRTPWIIVAVVAGLLLVVELVEWAWGGQPDWRGMLLAVGLMFFASSNLLTPQRRTLSLILWWLGAACFVVSLLLRFWR